MRKTNTYFDHLPGLWHLFLWYAPMFPLFYFTHPLIETNSNHMIWVSAILVFLVLFSPVSIGPFVTDCVVLIMYIVAVIMEMQTDYHDKLGVILFVSFALYLIFFFKYSLPDALEGRFRMK